MAINIINYGDKELESAICHLLDKVKQEIFIAEDEKDAISDGFDKTKNFHTILTDGRVVWLALNK